MFYFNTLSSITLNFMLLNLSFLFIRHPKTMFLVIRSIIVLILRWTNFCVSSGSLFLMIVLRILTCFTIVSFNAFASTWMATSIFFMLRKFKPFPSNIGTVESLVLVPLLLLCSWLILLVNFSSWFTNFSLFLTNLSRTSFS